MIRFLVKTFRFATSVLLTALLVASSAAADIELNDQKMERFLLKAKVTRIHMVVGATTNPMVLDLERKGETRRAAFKYGHFESLGQEISEDQGADQPILDSYKHEVAAYRLDRALDIHMVPVAVIRDVKTEGALVEWISDSYTEQELRDKGNYPSDPQRLDQQMAVMRLFDALILNLDRKENEKLITPSDWKLHLIDHSRGFRTSEELPESFTSQPVSLPRYILKNLKKLKKDSLEILLGDFLSGAQIDTLLARRDSILEKTEGDLNQYGERAVFQD
jgi:hypothetical protein